jgi:hypothetical protein
VTVLTRIASRLRSEGGLLADAVAEPATASSGWEPIEAIREGYLLHYGGVGGARILATEDADLALLAGDRLYALGLADLADVGDLEAVRTMAEVIAQAAAAQAAGDVEAAEDAWLAAPQEPASASGDR